MEIGDKRTQTQQSITGELLHALSYSPHGHYTAVASPGLRTKRTRKSPVFSLRCEVFKCVCGCLASKTHGPASVSRHHAGWGFLLSSLYESWGSKQPRGHSSLFYSL